MSPRLTLALAALPLAACQVQMDEERDIRAPAIEVVGPAESCISLNAVRDTTVHDDYTIDFHMAGDKVYRNTLDGRCPSLGFEESFTYSTSLNRLCNTDIIYVLYTDGTRGAGCGLGEFLPVKINK